MKIKKLLTAATLFAVRKLYPDHAAYKREEQRRFEILDSHWDLPVKAFALKLR
jgi:hypothetical protein